MEVDDLGATDGVVQPTKILLVDADLSYTLKSGKKVAIPKFIGGIEIISFSHMKNSRVYVKARCPQCDYAGWITSLPDLKSFKAKKCCANKGKQNGRYKHGGAINHHTQLYSVYHNIIARCEKPANSHWDWYGGKGIKMCKDWRDSFVSFEKWAKENGYVELKDVEYKEKLSIDRIDSTKDYTPENCQWITISENSRKAQLMKGGRHACN